ncbi:pyridoxamine 5'-phosphate oxidase family protein [Fodinicola acaciae]|uniref:pyridoxamine 5'-phosphate oxidase family protein n=1 Tax=Fodinicola acaciae TaxID=2681555 RepID=UPI0013D10775|nr:pyridoxamine 5'-phosphate oxidase family protein [Fodinicola acaciae]
MTDTRALVRRKSQRASYDWQDAADILDAAPLCHVATVRDDAPVVLPMAHGRLERDLVLHGSAAAGLFRDFRNDSAVCVTATLFDGVVLGRSARYHSMNYRSVAVHGRPVRIEQPDLVRAALRAVVDHVVPGRWTDVRPPTPAEVRETGIWRLPIEIFSVKRREGPPLDPEEDRDLPGWTGVIPSWQAYGEPLPAAGCGGERPPRTPR